MQGSNIAVHLSSLEYPGGVLLVKDSPEHNQRSENSRYSKQLLSSLFIPFCCAWRCFSLLLCIRIYKWLHFRASEALVMKDKSLAHKQLHGRWPGINVYLISAGASINTAASLTQLMARLLLMIEAPANNEDNCWQAVAPWNKTIHSSQTHVPVDIFTCGDDHGDDKANRLSQHWHATLGGNTANI